MQDWMDILKVISTTATSSMQVDDDYSDLEEEYRDDCKEKFVKLLKEKDSIIDSVMRFADKEVFLDLDENGRKLPVKSEQVNFDGENFDGYRGHSAYKYRFKQTKTGDYQHFNIIIRGQISKARIPDEVYCLALEDLKREKMQRGEGHFSDGFSNTKKTHTVEGEEYVVKVKKTLAHKPFWPSSKMSLYFRVQIYSTGSKTEIKTYTPESASELEFLFDPFNGNSPYIRKPKYFRKNMEDTLKGMYNEVIRAWGI